MLSTPVPEAAAMPPEEINALNQQALTEASAQGITGKAVTHFLQARIQALTGGRSLATNIALVKHNADVGARLALTLAHVEHEPVGTRTNRNSWTDSASRVR